MIDVLGDRPDMAPSTLRAYRGQWQRWSDWAESHDIEPMPADPEKVAEYLVERHEHDGLRPASLAVAAAAIAHVHSDHDHLDPCSHPVVKRTLKGIRRTDGDSQRQARALNADGVDAIIATAFKQRRSRSGRLETPIRALARGARDIAIVLTMRDAMLRVGEAAALHWDDVQSQTDGSGRLTVRRSKTDKYGDGAVLYLSPPTMTALGWIRQADGRVFGLEANQIAIRIKAMCAAAGLGTGFSGHSPRVGMAQDLARAGVELPALMTAGRWSSPKMAARYTRNETADRGAVAEWHRGRAGGNIPANMPPTAVAQPPKPEPSERPSPKRETARPPKAKPRQRTRPPQSKPDPKPAGPARDDSLVTAHHAREDARRARRERARDRAKRRDDT